MCFLTKWKMNEKFCFLLEAVSLKKINVLFLIRLNTTALIYGNAFLKRGNNSILRNFS